MLPISSFILLLISFTSFMISCLNSSCLLVSALTWDLSSSLIASCFFSISEAITSILSFIYLLMSWELLDAVIYPVFSFPLGSPEEKALT
jgi:hypothetical protein